VNTNIKVFGFTWLGNWTWI